MKRKSISKDHNPAIKGYLPIRILLPSSSSSKQQQQHSFTSFIYIKEHIQRSQGNNATNNSSSGGGSDTLFVANAPSNGIIRTDILLQSLFEVYGDIERVTVAQNPRKANLSSSANNDDEKATEIFRESAISNLDIGNIFATDSKSEKGNGKFAHVVFTSPKEMKRALKLIKKEISDAASKNNGVFDMKLNDDRMEQLKLESQHLDTKQQNREEEEDSGDSQDDEEEVSSTAQLSGIQAIAAQARRTANRHISRSKLMQMCNEAMAAFETQETLQEENAKRLAEEPDEDGFITVTSKSSTPSFGITNDLEEEVHTRRGKSNKRNRKRKAGGSGADELTDFYRFQLKEQRKKEVIDLKQRFEDF